MVKGKMVYVAVDDAKTITKALIKERARLFKEVKKDFQNERDKGIGFLSTLTRINNLIEKTFNFGGFSIEEIYDEYYEEEEKLK